MATTEKTIEIPEAILKAENIKYDNAESGFVASNAQAAIDEAAAVAKGRNRAHIFSTTADMQAWLSNEDNKGLYNVGDNIYIVDLDVPDWWIAEVLEEADSKTGYYYKIGQLETQKVDLTEIEADIDTINSKLSGSTSNIQKQIDALNNMFNFVGVDIFRCATNKTYDQIAFNLYMNDTDYYKVKFSKEGISYDKVIDGVSTNLAFNENLPVGTVIMNESTKSSGISYGTWEYLGATSFSIVGSGALQYKLWRRTA